jgi:hypothetical protein
MLLFRMERNNGGRASGADKKQKPTVHVEDACLHYNQVPSSCLKNSVHA